MLTYSFLLSKGPVVKKVTPRSIRTEQARQNTSVQSTTINNNNQSTAVININYQIADSSRAVNLYSNNNQSTAVININYQITDSSRPVNLYCSTVNHNSRSSARLISINRKRIPWLSKKPTE